jgi:hypothetical protein
MRKLCSFAAACSLVLLAAAPGRAATFNDVTVTIELWPRGASNHGSSEYVFGLKNTSKSRNHTVTVTIPVVPGGGDDHIVALSRTVTLEPEKTARLSLLQPYYPPINGGDVRVNVDGTNYGTAREPALRLQPSRRPFSGGAAPWGGGGGPGGPPGAMGLGASSLLLISPEGPEDFQKMLRAFGGGMQVEREETPVAAWSATWQGYSRYDGIILTGREWKAAPDGVRTALEQYAETGGFLLLLDPVPLPKTWEKRPTQFGLVFALDIYSAGFGTCVVSPDSNIHKWEHPRWNTLIQEVVQASQSQQQLLTAADANSRFPVVEDVQVPVRGLFALMVVFTLIIGPGNLWVLARMQRRIWMLWTVPCISFVTCAAVFGFMLIVEGWRGESRIEAITILDENTDRATSVAWVGVYAPMTPGDGLHFSSASDVLWLKGNEDRYAYGGRGNISFAACTIDDTRDQHFKSGWVSARVPSHFKLRKSETAQHKRLAVDLAADGTLTATNALGSDVQKLWVADEKGIVYTAENVAPGAKVTLTRRKDDSLAAAGIAALRPLLTSDNWVTPRQVRKRPSSQATRTMKGMPPAAWPGGGGPGMMKGGGGPPVFAPPPAARAPEDNPDLYLGKRTYIAVLNSAPFIETPLANLRASEAKSTIFGILRDKDGN